MEATEIPSIASCSPTAVSHFERQGHLVLTNGQFTTDSPQRNATVMTIAWPSVSESVLQVRLGITVFCILTLPRVTLGITAKEVKHVAKAGRQLLCWSMTA